MTVIFLLIPLSVVIAAGFLGAFIWAVRSGQFEDTVTPSLRVLLHDAPARRASVRPMPGALPPQSPPTQPLSTKAVNPANSLEAVKP
jgi:cbb3-type cytochrome oxidase maturation protein